MQEIEQSETVPNSNHSNLSANHERSELTPLYSSSPDTGTLRLIVVFFTFFTITLTFGLAIQIYYGHPQVFRHGSVSSDDERCSASGVSIINEGGNAIDAAIATAFCLSVVNPHITGLGGGGIMLIYNQRQRKPVDSIDFRVTKSSDSGIGVPGFVAGLALAHKLYGVLPWEKLLEPAIHIASSEFSVPPGLLAARSHLLFNASHNNELVGWMNHLSSHSVISMPELAETLSSIAIHGSDEFYNKTLKNELSDLLDVNDIIRYKAVRGPLLHGTFKQFDIIVPGAGTGGPVLLQTLNNTSVPYILSLMEEFHDMADEWAFTSGSSIVAFDVDDIYVSLVSGLGSVLGSQLLMESGYILNNFLEITNDRTDNRPAVLMTPLIAVDSTHVCGKRFAIGASDVRDLSQVLIRLLENSTYNITDHIEAGRVRMLGKQVALELTHSPQISDEDDELLRISGYEFLPAPIPYPSINVIEKVVDDISAYSDSRGYGQAVTY